MPKYSLGCIATLVLILLYCFPANAQLQDEYLKGKITLQNNQQKEGYIKRESLEKMNCFIYFKETENQKDPVKYDTLSLTGFTMQTGEIFERIIFEPNPKLKNRYFFGSLLLRGKASVYETMYKEAQFYIISNDGINYPLQDDVLEVNATAITPHYFKNYLTKAIGDSFNSKISRMNFSEESILSIVSEYNKSQSSLSIPTLVKKSNVSFLILNVGIGKRSGNEKETYVQGIYRVYFPKYSKSTSINTGISYYKYRFSENYYGYIINYSRSLFSIPFQIQQNLLNKNIRPYFFAGFNICYIKETNDRNLETNDKGFQKDFGFGFLFGAGIEADIYKGLMAKIETRNEIYKHPISFGIGYNFSKKKR